MFSDVPNLQVQQKDPKLHDFDKILKKTETLAKIKKDILTKQK